MDILCSNADCPIFYKRRKVKKELEQKEKQIERLETISETMSSEEMVSF